MISMKMQSAINDQINAELWSAYLYLAMSLDAEAKALRGVANWFFVQWLEEQDHARIFQEYLNSRGAKVVLKQIDSVPEEWDDPLAMFQAALEHEKVVSEMIDNLVRLAFRERDFATLSRLQWFVDEQVEEEENATDQVVDFAAAVGDAALLHRLDEKLAERKYSKASALK